MRVLARSLGVLWWFPLTLSVLALALAPGTSWARPPGDGGGAGDDVERVALPSGDVDDPALDGWRTEVFHDAVKKPLGELGDLVGHPEQLDPAHAAEVIGEGFVGGPLRPTRLATVYTDGTSTVRRPVDLAELEAVEHAGAAGLVTVLGGLAAALDGLHDAHAKHKVFRIEPLGDGRYDTTSYLMLWAHADDATVQVNATWRCRWAWPSEDATPRLLRFETTDYEEVRVEAPGGALFTDCSESVLAHEPWYAEQVLRSAHHWWSRIETAISPDPDSHHGLAIADVDGDGLEDVYVLAGGGLPNRLLLQQPDGTVRDGAAAAGVDFLDGSLAALLVDLDGDDDPDLVLSTAHALVVARNDEGRFTRMFTLPTPASVHSIAAADPDADGDLDLYACIRHGAGQDEENVSHSRYPTPYHDARNGGRNLYLRNDGGWRFTDATAEVGLDQNNDRWSFAASWEDFDNDGDLDLYVANDFGRNNLYRNDEGRFTDVAAQAGVQDVASGMSVSWADYDGDGWMDVYVGNMFSSAGGRIAFQGSWHEEASDTDRSNLQRLARGNSLFRNLGDGTFADVSEEARVTMGRWAWGSKFADLNNDGREDIVVTNGFITGPDSHDL